MDTFIIFKKKNDFYLVNKKDTEKFQKIPKDKNYVLDFISSIANDYPNIKDFYENEYITLRVEKNSKNFFKLHPTGFEPVTFQRKTDYESGAFNHSATNASWN